MSAAPQLEPGPQPAYDQLLPAEIASPSRPSRLMVERVRLLWEQRWLLNRAVLAGLAIGALFAFLIPARFNSEARLMPPDPQSASGIAAAAMAMTGGGSLSPFATNLLGLKSSGALLTGMLRSRTVEDRIVDRFNLRQVYGEELQRDARRKLEENTSISEERTSGIISIRVSDHDPKRAAVLAQAYVEELDHVVAEVSTSAAHRERVFLEERLLSAKQELDDAAQNFSRFQSASATLDIKDQGRAMLEAAATLSGQLIAAESELKGLEAIYTPNNARVQAAQARVAELRRQLQRLGGEGATVADPPAADDAPYPSIRKLPLLGITYADLYRRTKIKEVVYETLTQQYELAKVQEAKETPTVKVLDAPNIPERKSFPPRLAIILLCTALSLMSAMCVILLQARWREIDREHAGKKLISEIWLTLRAHIGRIVPRPAGLWSAIHQIRTRL